MPGRVSRRRRDEALPRQHQHDFEARSVVLEPNFAAVQPRDRRDEAEAEPGSRPGPALLETHEALQHALAVGSRAMPGPWSADAIDGDRRRIARRRAP